MDHNSKHIGEFLKKIDVQKEIERNANASYFTDENSVAHLLNNDSNRHATGKLAQYKILLETCQFKLAAYFKYDKWGRPYTVAEKMRKENRRYIPSNDRVNGILDHENSYGELLMYCLNKQKRLDAAQMFLIDRKEGLEYMIFQFNAENPVRSNYVDIEFHPERKYFLRLLDQAIRVDKIKNF